MRLYEIDNANLIYAKFQGINTDLDLDRIFKYNMSVITFLTMKNDIIQNRSMVPVLNKNEKEIISVIDDNWPDLTDPDIINLTNKAKKMLDDITKERSKLVV